MGQAAKSMQRVVAAQPDGVIGPQTAKAYNDGEAAQGWAVETQAIHDTRAAFYREIAASNPTLKKYLVGWLNRDD